VKTGYTTSAGGCLCSRKIVKYNNKTYDFILVILGCKNQEDRFIETVAILKSFTKYLKMMKRS
jgi:D-alanyl-D-alanine carboxypeptidase